VARGLAPVGLRSDPYQVVAVFQADRI